jgi:hypothetical protein
MAPMKSLTQYIDRKPFFLEAPHVATNLPLTCLPSPRGWAPLQYQDDPRKKGGKGPPSPKGRRPLGQPPRAAGAAASMVAGAVAAASPPWGGTSPSSSTTPLNYPHCNLLANTMFDAIYYFL